MGSNRNQSPASGDEASSRTEYECPMCGDVGVKDVANESVYATVLRCDCGYHQTVDHFKKA